MLDGNEIINRKYRKELRHIHEAITIKMERKEKKSMALREAIANRMEVCVCWNGMNRVWCHGTSKWIIKNKCCKRATQPNQSIKMKENLCLLKHLGSVPQSLLFRKFAIIWKHTEKEEKRLIFWKNSLKFWKRQLMSVCVWLKCKWYLR